MNGANLCTRAHAQGKTGSPFAGLAAGVAAAALVFSPLQIGGLSHAAHCDAQAMFVCTCAALVCVCL